jgi:AraC-like DNA-binding protein
VGIDLFFNIGLIAGLMVSLVLLFYPRTSKNGNWLLGLSVLSLWYALLMTKLYQSGEVVDFPHLSRTGNIPAFLITPAFYLFTRFIFFRKRQLQKRDWIILLPVIFYLIDYIPYFVQTAEVKSEIIRTGQLENKHFVFAEGWLAPSWFHFYSRQIWGITYLVLSIHILWKKRAIYHNGLTNNNRKIFGMVAFLASMCALAFLPGFLTLAGKGPWYTVSIQGITVSVTLVSLALFLIFNPDYLYGFFWEKELNLIPISEEQNLESKLIHKPEENEIDSELCKKLEAFFNESKAYLRMGYSINDLSSDVNIPVYKISRAINSCFNSNFNQWINQYRLVEFETLVSQGLSKQLTLDALYEQCGFSNRTTFNAAFKKAKGITPSAYLKSFPVD